MESRLTVLHRSLGEDRHVSDPCCLGKGDQDTLIGPIALMSQTSLVYLESLQCWASVKCITDTQQCHGLLGTIIIV